MTVDHAAYTPWAYAAVLDPAEALGETARTEPLDATLPPTDFIRRARLGGPAPSHA